MIKKNIIIILFLSLTLHSCGLFKARTKDNLAKYTSKNEVKKAAVDKIKSNSMLIEGIKFKALGDFDAASENFYKALKLNPENDAAYYELAQISVLNNELDNALEFSSKAAEIDPNNIWYKQLQAEILLEKKNYNDAAKIYDNLIRQQPRNPEYLYELARINLLMGDYNNAVKIYDKLESLIGVNEPVSMQKESIYIFLNKPQKAINEIENLIKSYPDEIKYQIMLGDLYIEIGAYNEAKRIFSKIKKENPMHDEIDFYLSELYNNLGNEDSSYIYLKNAFANTAADINKKVFTILAYYGAPKSDTISLKNAYELSDILVETHPNDAKAYSVYADLLYKNNKTNEARDYYYKVIELDSSRYAVWEQLLSIEMELKNYESLASLGNRAVELFPEQALPYMFAGFGNSQIKNYSKAITYLKAGLNYLISTSPLVVEFYNLLADAYYYSGDYQNAFSTFDKALAKSPENATILNNYAYYLSLQGINLIKAKEMAEKANKLNPETAVFQDTYAWVLYQMGDYENAKIWLEKAIANGGDKDPDVLEHYGDILFKYYSDATKALEYWNKAKNLGGKSDLLDKKIKDSKLYE